VISCSVCRIVLIQSESKKPEGYMMELKYRFWFEKDGKPVLGRGGASILQAIDEYGSISDAAKSLGMSYRFVWNYLDKIENRLGKVVDKERGGKKGGKTTLTPLGREILQKYLEVEKKLGEISKGLELDLIK